MDTVSRGDWSRASGDLCRAASFRERAAHSDAALPPQEHDALTKPSFPSNGASEAPPHGYGTALLDDTGQRPDDGASRAEKGYRRQSSTAARETWEEATAMVGLAVPVIVTYLFEMLPGIVSIVLVGHVDAPRRKEYLDAAAMGVMFVNMTALSVGFGLASAMDTLCSQAFGAGGTKGGRAFERQALRYLATGALVLSAAFVVVGAVSWRAGDVLAALGQPPAVAALAGTFVRILIPGIPFLFLYELMRKVLTAQNVAYPMLGVAVAGNLLNVGLGYYLVRVADGPASERWLGAAVARTVCNVSFPLLLIAYLYASGRLKTFCDTVTLSDHRGNKEAAEEACSWKQLLKEAWKGIPQFVSLGIPGALQMCFEWWAFECLALVAGLLPDALLAIGANAILLNIASMVYMFYLGISVSANVRIGNALGAGAPARAALAARLSLALAAACSGLCAAVLVAGRHRLPRLFTADADLAAYTSRLLGVAALFQLPDAINGAVQGVFRGSGRQTRGALLNLAAYYVVGIPIGVVLAFQGGLGVVGLWVGMTIGLCVVGVVGTWMTLRSDWSALAAAASQRLVRE